MIALLLAAGIQLNAADLQYKPGPAALPSGTQYVYLEGDGRSEAIFSMRVKLPDKFVVPAHTHPRDERVTVLSGAVWLAMGDKLDRAAAKKISAGGFYVTPPLVKHQLWIEGETILQLNCQGPWGIEYVDPKDDPRKKK